LSDGKSKKNQQFAFCADTPEDGRGFEDIGRGRIGVLQALKQQFNTRKEG
jgi:hypothetical protein